MFVANQDRRAFDSEDDSVVFRAENFSVFRGETRGIV